jgi:hypothetical protein
VVRGGARALPQQNPSLAARRRQGSLGGRTMHYCIVCKQHYTPRYQTKAQAFATDDLEGREQHLSGICSNVCWDTLFPPENEESEDFAD